jgi:hypothetical protein
LFRDEPFEGTERSEFDRLQKKFQKMCINSSEFTKRVKAVEEYIDTMAVMKVMKENRGRSR